MVLFADRVLNVINREHVWHSISDALKFVKYFDKFMKKWAKVFAKEKHNLYQLIHG